MTTYCTVINEQPPGKTVSIAADIFAASIYDDEGNRIAECYTADSAAMIVIALNSKGETP